MKLSEIKGEKALDVLADIMEPAIRIMSDKRIAVLAKSGEKIKAVKMAIKGHKKDVIELLASLEQKDPKEYMQEINVLTLPVKLLEILNDDALQNLFTSQGQNTDEEHSGSATENTEGLEE